MCCSSSTPPAELPSGLPPARLVITARQQAALAAVLVLLWAAVLTLGVLCYLPPAWLVQLSAPGREAEALQYKEYADRHLHEARGAPDRRQVAEHLATAVANYLRALEIWPDLLDARINLTVAEVLANRDHAAGIAKLEAMLPEAGERRWDLEYNLGLLHAWQEDTAAALRYLDAAERSGMSAEEVWKQRALVHLQVNDAAQARAAFEQVLVEQTRLDREYRSMLRRSLETYRQDPDLGPILRQQVEAEITTEEMARYDLELIARVHGSDPEVAKTHNQLGRLCANAGELRKAREHFARSLQIWPGNPDASRVLPLLDAELRRRSGR